MSSTVARSTVFVLTPAPFLEILLEILTTQVTRCFFPGTNNVMPAFQTKLKHLE